MALTGDPGASPPPIIVPIPPPSGGGGGGYLGPPGGVPGPGSGGGGYLGPPGGVPGAGGSGAYGGSAPGSGSPSGAVGSDPVYQQIQQQEQAALDAASAQRDAAINQAIINYGALPDFSGDGGLGFTPQQLSTIASVINPNTGALADQYTKSGDSVLGQLGRAHDRALSTLRAQLAARGMLESGATGVGVGIENQNYQHGLSTAFQNLMHTLLGDQDSYLNAEQRAQSALESAAGDAYSRAVQTAERYPGTYSTTPQENPPAGSPAGGGHSPGAADVTRSLQGFLRGKAGGPSPVSITPNPTGGSRRQRGGIFSIH